jgi:hypothetical protein
MVVTKKTKPGREFDRLLELRRKRLLLLAGSISVEEAEALRAAAKTIRKHWR